MRYIFEYITVVIQDRFGRIIDYVRISLTDRCNLRCRYCMPSAGIKKFSHGDILRFEEIERIIRIFKESGINKFRFTGGEPLLRKGTIDFLGKLEIENFYLTTNLAIPNTDIEKLNNTGLSGINISCDSLKPHRYQYITRQGNIEVFLDNFKRLNIPKIKINVVVIKGFNDDEILDFIEFANRYNVAVRFIEKMDFNSADSSAIPDKKKEEISFISLSRVRDNLIREGIIEAEQFITDNSVAQYYKLKNHEGKVGFITHISNPFCGSCNRIRIKANGELKLCLFDRKNYNLRDLLRKERNDEIIKKQILEIIKRKHENPISTKSGESAAEIGG